MTHDETPPGAIARPPSRTSPPPPAHARQEPRSFESSDLFAGTDQVLIQHRGREYRLRITHSGKLILNA